MIGLAYAQCSHVFTCQKMGAEQSATIGPLTSASSAARQEDVLQALQRVL